MNVCVSSRETFAVIAKINRSTYAEKSKEFRLLLVIFSVKIDETSSRVRTI
jgi:hypothetical protein